MANSDQNLQAFINKMLQLQNESRDKPLSDEELKKIAFDIGMTEEDWQESQKAFQGYLKSGKGHLEYRNWKDAIQQLEQAAALKPNSLDALYALAVAHKEKWKAGGDPSHKSMAENYAANALQISPAYPPAMDLLNELRITEQSKQTQKTWQKVYLIGFSVAAVFFLAVIFFTLNNAVVSHNEEVNKKWAQVENVYQRRADLIPKLVGILKSQTKFEIESLNKLNKIYEEAANQSGGDPKAFQEVQKRLSKSLEEVTQRVSEDQDLSVSQAYRDIKIQIEGSENRIAVERKRYNEVVADYNQYIKQFPQSLLGYKEKPYFEVDKRALENPDLDLD
ncbi:MAG: LemA family protein [Microscillaceae bacterium]|nr:LemA family protein [Microscillaceae bacterium]